VTLDELRKAVDEVAAAALLARHWPDKGSRDKAAVALSGGLARAGWGEDRISCFSGPSPWPPATRRRGPGPTRPSLLPAS
jgi:hypothetical protein